MSLFTAFAIYFIIWWVTLFAVLPWGVRSQQESGSVVPGSDPGAPARASFWRPLIWTTLLASAIFTSCVAVYSYRIVTLEGLAALLGQ